MSVHFFEVDIEQTEEETLADVITVMIVTAPMISIVVRRHPKANHLKESTNVMTVAKHGDRLAMF